jgi:2'-5' RNA ligase
VTGTIEELADHWWWRPGWRQGRHFLACHIAFPDDTPLTGLVSAYQEVLRPFPGLDLIPRQWLHLTMQGIGFVDEIDDAQRTAILGSLTRTLRLAQAPEVTFAAPTVTTEAVYLLAQPAEPLQDLKNLACRALAEAGCPNEAPAAGATARQYRPHVSIAYSSGAQAAGPISAALRHVEATPVTVRLDTVYFLEFHRDHRMYEWTNAHPIRIGTG